MDQTKWAPARRSRFARRAGFSLIELMVVVTVIGILAAIAMPLYENYRRNARVGRTAGELRLLSNGFWGYYAGNDGRFPPDSHLTLPPGMETYINPTIWSDETPIGGHYNWEGPDNYAYAGLSIFFAGGNPMDEIEILDRILDDGDVTTGRFRLGSNGRPTLILQE